MNKKNIKWISIQSLAGGMALGAEKAFGCPPICTIDYDGIDKANSSAYMHYMNDIRHVGLKQLILDGNLLSMTDKFKSEEDEAWFTENCKDIDVVSAVPICSGLSAANTNNKKDSATKRGADAQQNNNMIGVTKFTLERIKPRAFIFENAPVLFTNSGKPVRERMNEIAFANGYSVTWVKTNTNKHANVQYRSRTFGIFWKSETAPQLSYVNNPHGTIEEYLKDLKPDTLYNNDEYIINPKITESGYFKYLIAKYGDNWRQKYIDSNGFNFFMNVVGIPNLEEVLPYCNEKEVKFVKHVIEKRSRNEGFMDTTSPGFCGFDRVPTVFHRSMGNMIHWKYNRGYNLREFMKFMGMPDDYEFENPKKHWIWVSQNVPVVTAYDWHKQIAEWIWGERELTDQKEVFFNNEKGPEVKKSKTAIDEFFS